MKYAEFDNAFTKSVRQTFELGSNLAMEMSYYGKCIAVGDTTEGLEKYTSTEGMEVAKFVNESSNLPVSKLKKGRTVFIEGKGYGHRITISKDARIQARDNTTIMEKHLAEETSRAITNMNLVQEYEGHRFFNQAFTTNVVTLSTTGRGLSLVSPDLEPLISNNHQYANGNTFDNLLPAAAMTLATFEEVERRSAAFVDAEGNPMPFMSKKIIVKSGGKAHQAAKRILGVRAIDSQYRVDNTDDINYRSYDGYTIVDTPYITDEDRYFFIADFGSIQTTLENPMFLHHQQRPTFEGLQQQSNNLDWVYPFYGHLKQGMRNLPIGIYGSQGA